MVLDKLTLFEVHLDGAQFGRKSLGDTSDAEAEAMETDAEMATETTEESSGGSRRLLALLVAGLAVAGVAAWRRRSGDQTTMDDYTEGESGLAESDSVELDDLDA
jgi:hypothetical protein